MPKSASKNGRTETPAGSARRVLQVLASFTADAPRHSVSAIAGQLALPQSSIYRYFAMLREAGFLEEDDSGYHVVTPLVLEIAAAAKRSSSLSRQALPFMQQLAGETGETVILIRASADRAVCIERVESPRPIRMTFDIGTALPMHRGAAPKFLLAHMPDADMDRILRMLVAEREITRAHMSALREEFDLIRRRSWSESHAEIKFDVYAAAAGVLERGAVTAALSVVAPAYRTPKRLQATLLRSVRKTAQALTTRLETAFA